MAPPCSLSDARTFHINQKKSEKKKRCALFFYCLHGLLDKLNIKALSKTGKGKPVASNSHLRLVRRRVRSLWVLCTQCFPTFCNDDVSMI
jgi:hypothetical protein